MVDWGRLLSGCPANSRTAGSNPVLPAAQGGKRTFRSGDTGEADFTGFLLPTSLIFFRFAVRASSSLTTVSES